MWKNLHRQVARIAGGIGKRHPFQRGYSESVKQSIPVEENGIKEQIRMEQKERKGEEIKEWKGEQPLPSMLQTEIGKEELFDMEKEKKILLMMDSNEQISIEVVKERLQRMKEHGLLDSRWFKAEYFRINGVIRRKDMLDALRGMYRNHELPLWFMDAYHRLGDEATVKQLFQGVMISAHPNKKMAIFRYMKLMTYNKDEVISTFEAWKESGLISPYSVADIVKAYGATKDTQKVDELQNYFRKHKMERTSGYLTAFLGYYMGIKDKARVVNLLRRVDVDSLEKDEELALVIRAMREMQVEYVDELIPVLENIKSQKNMAPGIRFDAELLRYYHAKGQLDKVEEVIAKMKSYSSPAAYADPVAYFYTKTNHLPALAQLVKEVKDSGVPPSSSFLRTMAFYYAARGNRLDAQEMVDWMIRLSYPVSTEVFLSLWRCCSFLMSSEMKIFLFDRMKRATGYTLEGPLEKLIQTSLSKMKCLSEYEQWKKQ